MKTALRVLLLAVVDRWYLSELTLRYELARAHAERDLARTRAAAAAKRVAQLEQEQSSTDRLVVAVQSRIAELEAQLALAQFGPPDGAAESSPAPAEQEAAISERHNAFTVPDASEPEMIRAPTVLPQVERERSLQSAIARTIEELRDAPAADIDEPLPSAWDPEPVAVQVPQRLYFSKEIAADLLQLARDKWCEKAELVGTGADRDRREYVLYCLVKTLRVTRSGSRGAYSYRTADDAAALPVTDGSQEHAPPAVSTVTRDQQRSRRAREVRGVTISRRRLTKRVLEAGRQAYPEAIDRKPRMRSQCANGLRPCPFVSCRHHLYLDVDGKGSIKLNFPDLEPDELSATCSLDVADEGSQRLERCGALMNVTRERIRQLEAKAIERLHKRHLRVLSELAEDIGGASNESNFARAMNE